MSAVDDHYAALGVAPDASLEEIRAAWRLRVVAFHPDRFRDEGQRSQAEHLSQQANAAWQTLSNPALRARHDRQRTGTTAPRDTSPPTPTGPPLRHLPCAGCATRVATPDARGDTIALTCPACGLKFSAIVGGRTWGRAHLIRRGVSIHHEIDFVEPGGGAHSVRFRKLPPELAMAEGELLSVVFHPRHGRPVYAVAHHETMDLAWRVR